jgi:hypothetical protein
MTPEEKDMLRRSLELGEQNNKILRGMLSKARWGMFFRIFYWCVIIAFALSAYYYVKPYIEVMQNTYQSISSDINNIKSVTTKIPNTIGGFFTK